MFRDHKKIFRALVISLLCLTTACYAKEQDKEEEVLFVAKKAFEDSYYEVSIGLLNRFLSEFPDSSKAPEAELLLGESYFYRNKLLEALGKFEGLLNKPSAESIKDAVLYWIAETYFKSNNFSKATGAYRKIIEEFPNSSYTPLAFYSLGWSLFEEGKFQEALGYFKVMEDKYPKEPQTLDAAFKIAECLYNLKDYSGLREKARQLLKFFSKDTPRRAYLYFYLAEAEYYLDNFNQAIDFFKKALKESSDNKLEALSRLGAGWSYLKLKEYKKAEEEFTLVKEEALDKQSLEALSLGKADTLLKQGKLTEAKAEFQKVAEASDDKIMKESALVRIADIYQDLGDYSSAVEVYKTILNSYPAGSYEDYTRKRMNTAVYALGLEYFQKQDYDSSLRILEQVRPDAKESGYLPEVSYLLGSCYYNLGNFSKAVGLFQDVVSRSQDAQLLQKAEYAIADSLYHLGKEKEALSRFNALRSRYPGSDLTAGVIFWLAGYYYQQDELDLADRYFLSLVQDFPKSDLAADAYYSMGLISIAKGQIQEAIPDFKKAMELGKPDLRALSIFALAEALEAGGDFDAAVKEYIKISSDYKFKEKALLRVARIYEDKDDFREAVKFYKQVLAMGGKSAASAREKIDWIESNIKK